MQALNASMMRPKQSNKASSSVPLVYSNLQFLESSELARIRPIYHPARHTYTPRMKQHFIGPKKFLKYHIHRDLVFC